jgi:hypothetical protein
VLSDYLTNCTHNFDLELESYVVNDGLGNIIKRSHPYYICTGCGKMVAEQLELGEE